MFKVKTMALTSLVAATLAACATTGYEIGYLSLKNSTKSSVDSWIIDGKTTKDQVAAAVGPYQHDNPNMAESQKCKKEQKFCIYMVNTGSYVKSIQVNYDENDVVTSHRFSETYRK